MGNMTFLEAYITMGESIDKLASIESGLNLIVDSNGITIAEDIGLTKAIDNLNKIRIEIPNWVPNFGGNSWSPNIAQLESIARGQGEFTHQDGVPIGAPSTGIGIQRPPEMYPEQEIVVNVFIGDKQVKEVVWDAIDHGIEDLGIFGPDDMYKA